jgi:hypothetical protein
MSMKEVSRQLKELSTKFEKLETKFDGLETKFDGLETKVDEGFNASKVRDEELMGLMKFGLEAREALRESMENRFDEADRKHNQQIDLLNDAVRYLNSHK